MDSWVVGMSKPDESKNAKVTFAAIIPISTFLGQCVNDACDGILLIRLANILDVHCVHGFVGKMSHAVHL